MTRALRPFVLLARHCRRAIKQRTAQSPYSQAACRPASARKAPAHKDMGSMARAIKLPAPGGYRIFRGVFGIQDGGAGGGARGSRTPDLLNAIQALSQLSYGPVHPIVPQILCSRIGTRAARKGSAPSSRSNAARGV